VEVIQWEVSGWRFEVAAHEHQAGSLRGRMRAVAGSELGQEVEEDEGVLPSCRLVMFVVSTVSVQEVLVVLPSFSPTFP
jgi:hypothetical protein